MLLQSEGASIAAPMTGGTQSENRKKRYQNIVVFASAIFHVLINSLSSHTAPHYRSAIHLYHCHSQRTTSVVVLPVVVRRFNNRPPIEGNAKRVYLNTATDAR
jgi:hypothetical protein